MLLFRIDLTALGILAVLVSVSVLLHIAAGWAVLPAALTPTATYLAAWLSAAAITRYGRD